MFVPYSACEPSSVLVPYSIHIMVSFSDDDCEYENSPLPTHLPPDDSIEHEPAPVLSLPVWVHSTQEPVGDIFSDPRDQCQTCS
jgi:hypothetical protein